MCIRDSSVDNMDETGGNTNIAFGRVTQIWKDFMSAVQIEEARAAQMSGEGEAVSYVPTTPFPSEEELTEAARHTDISSLILDEEARTVYLADPDMRLDAVSYTHLGKSHHNQQDKPQRRR